MIFYGYTVFQAERSLARAEQREADARLGSRCAALAQWRRSLASPARALRRASGADLTGPRACVPADCGLAARTGV